jgi:hypothetical protein
MIGSGEILIILICLIGFALAAALVVAVVFLAIRSATRGRDTDQRLRAIESELRELKNRLPSGPPESP